MREEGKETERAIRTRLRRAEGQIHGILRMLEEGQSCEEVVTQLMAVRAAVDRAAAEVVASHLDQCLATLPPDEARTRAGQAVRLLARLH
ncbi:MAG TPA: metal-sensing transcriptional repressor [Chloroflexota bacterium]|nr:metal-sensing transcriptional repressor [Chloroflexota bacterium]